MVFQEVYSFTKRNPDRGYTYTPYALVLDYYHGLPFGLWNGNKIFESITPGAGDMMTQNIFTMLYPDWNKEVKLEQHGNVNTPYGDVCDVLLQNASAEVLASYPAVILSGDIRFGSDEIERYRNYVKGGGILVLNTAYLKYFPEWKRSGGPVYEIAEGGRVIVYGDDYDITCLPRIITSLNNELLPFSITEDLHYLLNVRSNSLIISVFNHNGVTKISGSPERFDMSQTRTFDIIYRGDDKLQSVTDTVNDKTLPADNKQTVTLKPGEYIILEYAF